MCKGKRGSMKKICRELGGRLWQDGEVGPCFKCWISYLRRKRAVMFHCFHKVIVWSIWLYPKIILVHFNVTYRSQVQLEILIGAEAIMPRDRLWNVARIDLYPPLRLWMNNGQMLSSTAHPHYPWCLLSLHLAVIDLFSVCATMKIGKKM